MPTKNPRINLSVAPDLYDLISRLAKVSGKSMSASIVEMLEEARPVLERVVVVGEAARKVQDHARGAMRSAVDQTEAVVESHTRAALEQVDWLLQRAANESQQAPGKGQRRPAGARPATPWPPRTQGPRKAGPRKASVKRQEGRKRGQG